MQTEIILSPYFLDQPLPDLETFAGGKWLVNNPELKDGDAQARMSVIHKGIAAQVNATVAGGRVPVSIAGDCCTAIGVCAGLQRAGLDPYLVWFDAHGDFNTWDITPSGFLGGMPLAMIAGLGEQTMPLAVGLQPLEHSKIILTDGRDLDPGERELVESSGILHLTDVRGLPDALPPYTPLHIHFDTDIINPVDAPAMNYVADGGPRAAELKGVFQYLASRKNIAAVSVSTWNPELDRDGSTAKVCMHLLNVMLGK